MAIDRSLVRVRVPYDTWTGDVLGFGSGPFAGRTLLVRFDERGPDLAVPIRDHER